MARRTDPAVLQHARAPLDTDLPADSPSSEAPRWPGTHPALIDDSDDSLENVLAELGGVAGDGAKIMVYRAHASSQRKVDAFLYECAPAEFSITDLARRYGGGEYRIKGYRYDSVQGKRTLFLNQLVAVEAPIEAPVPVAAPALDPVALLAPVVAAMQSGFERLAGLFAAAQPKQESRADFLNEILTMKQVFAPTTPQLGADDMLKLISQGIEIGKGTQIPDDTEGAVMLETVKGIMPLLGKMAEKSASIITNPGPAHSPPIPRIPAPAVSSVPGPAPVVPPLPAAPSPESSDMRPQIAYAVNMLCAQAARGSDPGLYAEVLADQLPEDALRSVLDQPDLIGMLAGFNPAVRQHEAWFIQLADALRELLQDEPESGNDAQTGQ